MGGAGQSGIGSNGAGGKKEGKKTGKKGKERRFYRLCPRGRIAKPQRELVVEKHVVGGPSGTRLHRSPFQAPSALPNALRATQPSGEGCSVSAESETGQMGEKVDPPPARGHPCPRGTCAPLNPGRLPLHETPPALRPPPAGRGGPRPRRARGGGRPGARGRAAAAGRGRGLVESSRREALWGGPRGVFQTEIPSTLAGGPLTPGTRNLYPRTPSGPRPPSYPYLPLNSVIKGSGRLRPPRRFDRGEGDPAGRWGGTRAGG